MQNEVCRLRSALRDLVALSSIPAAWIGREPTAIAAGFADVLMSSLHLDFALVRFCNPWTGGTTVEVTRGNVWEALPDWLQRHLSVPEQSSRKRAIPNYVRGQGLWRCLLMPFGSNVDVGLVAVACERTDFPTETDQLLLSVAANHAATAFHIASLIQERRCAEEKLRQARDELEVRVTERTAELQRTMGELSNVSRVATAATLSTSIAHETNQPLTAIVARA